MESNANAYVVLGIQKTDDQDIIKQGYKNMIKLYHPDKNPNRDTTIQFLKVQKAYETLSDPLKKREHDSKLLLQEKKASYSQSRRQMINNLIQKEAKHSSDRMTQNKRPREEWKNSDYRFNSMNTANGTIKLTEYLQVRMSREKAFDFSSDILTTYFKEYGVIEDILMVNGRDSLCHKKKADYEALIHFKYNLKIDQLIERVLLDKSIRQLFQIKKKSMTKESYDRKKRKCQGESHLGKKIFKEDEGNEAQSAIKTEKVVNDIINNHNEDKDKERTSHINFNSISLEDFEKAVFG